MTTKPYQDGTDLSTPDEALTQSFTEAVQARARRDPAFRDALLMEGLESLLLGEADTGAAERSHSHERRVGLTSELPAEWIEAARNAEVPDALPPDGTPDAQRTPK
jgi:hypothetical protein